MRKFIVIFLFAAALGLLFYKYGFRELLTPGAVKKVRGPRLEELRKNAEKAEKDFKKHLESADRVGTAYERLGRTYLKNRNWTPAIQSFQKAVEYGQSGARVHYSLGVAYANRAQDLSDKKDVKEAEKHYRRAMEKNPDFHDAEYGLAILKFYTEDERREGIRILSGLVSRQPDYFRGRFALARFYYEDSRPDMALSVYESLYSDLEASPDSPKIREYRKQCKENISRLMMELSGRK